MPPKPAPAAPKRPETVEEANDRILGRLKEYYDRVVLPLEKMYRFDAFHSPPLTHADIDAAPIVVFIGPFSTGKSSSIRKLLERDAPGMHIAPEPSTDKFMAIMHGEQEREFPGNALASMDEMPFKGTQQFGMAFLNRFVGVTVNSPILRSLTFIDTPGVLSGEKQRTNRSYDFPQVIEWFAGRADRILVLFDAHKLDISDELKSALEALLGNEDKVRVILNKADAVSPQQLMRVYGALMWSLARVFKFPEVVRVYVASLWDKPFQNKESEALLRAEEADLFADLRSLPRNSVVRKVNEIVKRARQVRVHAFIVAHLRDQFGFFGKQAQQKKLLTDLPEQFKQVMRKHALSVGDFPNLNRFREAIQEFPIHDFPKLNPKMIEALENMLSVVIPDLVHVLPGDAGGGKAAPPYDAAAGRPEGAAGDDEGMPNVGAQGGAAAGGNAFNPFEEDPDRAATRVPWAIDEGFIKESQNAMFQMRLTSGKLSGAAARDHFLGSGLTVADLKAVWNLSDIDRDGYLDVDEYVLACYLIDQRRKRGVPIPTVLDEGLIPPSKRV